MNAKELKWASISNSSDAELEEQDQLCWETMRMIKAVREFRKFEKGE